MLRMNVNRRWRVCYLVYTRALIILEELIQDGFLIKRIIKKAP